MRRTMILLAVLLAGCASDIPVNIRNPPADNPLLPTVARDARPFIGKAVRWGGTVIGVKNQPGQTVVEILARDLDSFGRPIESDQSPGRFLAQVQGFLDPQIYRADRAVTVSGSVEPSVAGKIGEEPYTYPLVKADHIYLWAEYPAYYNPYYQDPFCDPFYYPWPYRRPLVWPYYDPFWGMYPPFCR